LTAKPAAVPNVLKQRHARQPENGGDNVLKNLDPLLHAEVPRAFQASKDVPFNPAVQEQGQRA
jgi:hypothetical protein